MIRNIIFSLTTGVVLLSGYWLYQAPNETEPKVTFLAALIGLLTAFVERKHNKEKQAEVTRTLSGRRTSKLKSKQPKKVERANLEEDSAEKKSVFTSYTHDTTEHKQKVLDFANRLNEMGIDCWIDRYVEDNPPARGWPAWMDERVRLSSEILVVFSERYLARLEGREIAGKGLGGKFESFSILQKFYNEDSQTTKIIPIILNSDDKKYIPLAFSAFTYYNVSDEGDFDKLYRRLTNQPLVRKPTVGSIVTLQSEQHQPVNEMQEQPKIHKVEEITSMKPGYKILQAFFSLPFTRRFEIGKILGVLTDNETVSTQDQEGVSQQILRRAKEKNMLGKLWTLLFDENIDPNPFKTN